MHKPHLAKVKDLHAPIASGKCEDTPTTWQKRAMKAVHPKASPAILDIEAFAQKCASHLAHTRELHLHLQCESIACTHPIGQM